MNIGNHLEIRIKDKASPLMDKGKLWKLEASLMMTYDYKLSIYHMSTFINVMVH